MYLGSQKVYKPLRERIRHFTPAWHAINTGTGAVAALLHIWPYGTDSKELQCIALFFELLNLVLFVALTACSVARYTIFRGMWSTMLLHPMQSLYLGCFPMGLSNLIVGATGVIYEYFGFGGTKFLYGLYGCWWINVVMSVVICFGQLHIMFTRQTHEVHLMSLIWLLPIVTMIVAASAGVDVARAMSSVDSRRVCLTLAISMALVTIGVMLTFAIFTIYIYRLIVHGLPEKVSIFSAFLPLGSLGQAGYAFLLMGEISRDLFPLQDGISTSIFIDPLAPRVLYICAWLLAFAMWSFATCWLLLAILAIGDTPAFTSLPFTIMFWGTLFPNGAYARLTLSLASSFDSEILRIWGTIYACFTFCLWVLATVRSLPGLWNGSLFEAPDLITSEVAELSGLDPPENNKESTLMRTRSPSVEPEEAV